MLSLLALTLVLYALHVQAQLEPYRSAPVVVQNDECLDVDSVPVSSDISQILSEVAATIANGTRSDGCLDSIYLLVFTGSTSNSAGSNHPHNFEVIGAGQTRHITLPDRPGDYEQHQGDIWKLNVVSDLQFLPGTCLRICNIEAVRLAEGGNDGWLVDSAVSFGCIDNVGCSLLTMDLDVHSWIDGNGFGDVDDLPLTLATTTSCV